VDYEAISPTVKITGTPDAGAQKTERCTVTTRTLVCSCDDENVGATGYAKQNSNCTNKAKLKFRNYCVITIEFYYYYYCIFIITNITYSIL
jgi:hypothetical protein